LGALIDGGHNQVISLSNGASIKLAGFKLEQKFSFLDYIFGGCEIKVHVAIDFTLSNGDPRDPKSLHYIDPRTQRNNYTDAIHSCLSILENYDKDKMFPIYGFGGKVPECQAVSHCFALNGDIFSPEVNGVNGVLNAYYQA